MVTLQILGGRKEKIRPGDVLGALTGRRPATPASRSARSTSPSSPPSWRWSARIAHGRHAQLNAGKVKGKSVKVRLL